MTTSTIVDELGAIQAEIADLQDQAKAFRAKLVEAGVGTHEGALFSASVSETERNTLDMRAVRLKLTRQFIVANTNVTSVTTVKVTARSRRVAA